MIMQDRIEMLYNQVAEYNGLDPFGNDKTLGELIDLLGYRGDLVFTLTKEDRAFCPVSTAGHFSGDLH